MVNIKYGFNPLSDIMRCFDHTPEQTDSDSLVLYGKPFTREFSLDSNVSGYEVPTNFSGFKVSGHGTKPRRFTIGFVAACVNGNMNPVFNVSVS
jgi:hypothetical protein